MIPPLLYVNVATSLAGKLAASAALHTTLKLLNVHAGSRFRGHVERVTGIHGPLLDTSRGTSGAGSLTCYLLRQF